MKTPARVTATILFAAGILVAGYLANRQQYPAVSSDSGVSPDQRVQQTQAVKEKKVKDLVCGVDVDPKSLSTFKTQYKGATYYFCSKMCKESFEANPEKYIPKTTVKKAEKVKDLVCGMDIDPKAPGTVKSVYKGKTYYFCSKFCKKSFDANPEDYIHEGMAPKGKQETGTGK